MSSLLDTMGSFFVGGMVLIGLAGMLLHVNGSTQDTIMSEICQVSAVSISSTLEYDIRKAGYRVMTPTKILQMDSARFTFLADLDNNGSSDTVAYHFHKTGNGIDVSRSGSSGTAQWKVSASRAFFTYLDSSDQVTTVPNRVRSIVFEIVLLENVIHTNGTEEQTADVNADAEHPQAAGTFLRRQVRPVNLGIM